MSKESLQDVLALVVDDNPQMRVIMRSMLANAGVKEILLAEDGHAALDIHRHLRLDVIVTDLMMPDMSGFELCQHVRSSKRAATSEVPIIVVSGHADRSIVERARDVGATEFLCKPLSMEALSSRLNSVITNPRRFIRNATFSGPDRRRKEDRFYMGPERRSRRQRPAANSDPSGNLNQREVDAILREKPASAPTAPVSYL